MLHDFGGEGPVLLMLHAAGFLGQVRARIPVKFDLPLSRPMRQLSAPS